MKGAPMVATTLCVKYHVTRTDQPAEIVEASSKTTEPDAILSIHSRALRAHSESVLMSTDGAAFAGSVTKSFFAGFLDGMSAILRVPWPRRRK